MCNECLNNYEEPAIAEEEMEEEEEDHTGEFYCDNCQEWHPARGWNEYDVYTEGGNLQTWCQDCVDDNAFYCDCCDCYYDRNWYAYEEVNGDTVCGECLEQHYVRCDDCGCYIEEDEAISVGDDYGRVCQSCYESNYFTCSRCGNVFHNDYAEYDDDDNMCCSNCYDQLSRYVRSYHDDPEKCYFINDGRKLYLDYDEENSFKGLGIELEIDRTYEDSDAEENLIDRLREHFDTDNEELYFTHDGSLSHGFEIITQPHEIDAFYRLPWETILNLCREYGYTSHNNGNCGLHVHVSRSMFGDTENEQFNNIAKIVGFYEIYYDDIRRISRRSEYSPHYARKLDDITSIDCDKELFMKDCDETSKMWKNGSRYYAINRNNRQTIEFRLRRGTLSILGFNAWIDFTLTIVRNAKYIDWDDIKNLAVWFDGIKPETVEYMKEYRSFKEYTTPIETVTEDDSKETL